MAATKNSRPLVLAAIRDNPLTIPEIATACDISQPAAKKAIEHLRDEGIVRIAEWAKSGSNPCPVAHYTVGSGPDEKRPQPMTYEERLAAKRADAKRRRNAEYERLRLAEARVESEERRIAREQLENFVPFRDPLIAAFYGEYQREAVCTT